MSLPVPPVRQAEEMIEDVRTAFIQNTKHLSWMDDETREKAEDKAEAITKMMGETSRCSYVKTRNFILTELASTYANTRSWN